MRDFQAPGRSAVFATNGICATSHPLAAEAAVGILKDGGNAVDAAIGGAVLLALCEPLMTGLGGDCFVLFSESEGAPVKALNGSGRAPAASDSARLRAEGMETIPLGSAHSVTVPGAIDAFCALSERHGRKGLGASFAPAIRYAEDGVPVAPRVVKDWSDRVSALQGVARNHYLWNGAAPRVGDLFRAPGQAEVLRRVAQQGRDAFYTGEIADDMLATLSAGGGVHTAEDFAATAHDWTQPIRGEYAGHDLWEHPPNGQGATAILMLNMLAQFDLSGLDPLGAERVHLETEVAKLAYDARNRMIADPSVLDATERMLSAELARDLAALIRPDAVVAHPREATEAVHKDTVYITVVDRDRMAVSLIFSIFHGFGSGLASEKFGLLLHNRGAGFTLEQGHPNELGPRKRPMHTIIPGMLGRDGRATMPFGVMGGQYQSAGHAHVLTGMLDFGQDPQTALDSPRSFPEGGKLSLETGFPEATAARLREIGHDVVRPDMPIGGGQAIRIHENGVLEGASDPRKDGCAIGY